MIEVTRLDPTVDYSRGLATAAEDLRQATELIEHQKALLEAVHRRALERELRRIADREGK